MSEIPRMTLNEYHATLCAQGVPSLHMAVVCPRCGTVQSMADLIDAHAKASPILLRGRFGPVDDGEIPAEPRRVFGRSCVGRYSEKPDRGCDWTLGGFLQIHRLVVAFSDGFARPAFEPATPEQAQARGRERGDLIPSTT